MAQQTLILFVLGFVLLALIINLLLTFRLISTIKYLRIDAHKPRPLLPGSSLANFGGKNISDGSIENSAEIESALVLLFLSARCDKCKSRLPEIERLSQLTGDSVVRLKFLTNEPVRRFKKFLNSRRLINSSLKVDNATYDALNPEGASPYYLFVDDERIVQAAGFIGDENWLSFVEQVQDASAMA